MLLLRSNGLSYAIAGSCTMNSSIQSDEMLMSRYLYNAFVILNAIY